MAHRLPLVFAHGNGIPRPVYQKMLVGLSHRFIATGVDRFGHEPAYQVTDSWPRLIDQLRSSYDHEASHVWPHAEAPRDEAEQELLDHRSIRNAVISAEREAVIRLRDEGIINDETLRRIERDLDLEALRAN